jgi:cell division protein FtsQ
MARKQAKRRKQKKAQKFKMPTIRIGRIVTPLVAMGIIVAAYHLTMATLDTEISSIEISGPFQRVTALQIEEAISNEIDEGFVGADLDRIQDRIVALTWIDQARVARRWPSRISITVTEQVPAAIWGERGLLNTRGDLFVAEARLGLDLRRVHLDARGSWEMTLGNGIDVRIGRRDVDVRTDLFLGVVADIITGRAADIDYVDLRYGNGFTIGWKGGSKTPVSDPQKDSRKLLASRGTE